MRIIAKCIHISAIATRTNSNMKQLVHTFVRSFRMPKQIGRKNPPRPPIRPTMPATEPTLSGVIYRNVFINCCLAERHEHLDEHNYGERYETKTHAELHITANTMYHIISGRIAEYENSTTQTKKVIYITLRAPNLSEVTANCTKGRASN